MSDASFVELTAALIKSLGADAQLGSLATRGAWEDPAPQPPVGEEGIAVVVKLQAGRPSRTGDRGRHAECFYSVQAVGPAALIANIKLAAARIDRIFDGGPLLEGYRVIGASEDELLERTEPEPGTGIRWEWRGGIYRLFVVATS